MQTLDQVVLDAIDPAAAVAGQVRLLGREACPSQAGEGPGGLFRLENVALRIPGGPGSREGVAALVFGAAEARPVAPEAARGVSISVVGPERRTDGLEPGKALAAPESTLHALDHVVVLSSDLDASRALYERELGLRLALDRSFEARRARILFFRVGGATVEVGGSFDAARSDEPDRLWGLAWKAADVRAAWERIRGEGFDVTGVRAGAKPGTLVFTVRDAPAAVPTLVIGPDPDAGRVGLR